MKVRQEMRDLFGGFTSLIFKDGFFQIVVGFSALINIGIWAFLYLEFSPFGNSEDVLPLHYNIYFGVDLVGAWSRIFVLPLVGAIFIVVNFLIADIIYLRDKVIGYFLAGTGLFIQILLFGAVFMVAMINQ
jgi:hypothetical protein